MNDTTLKNGEGVYPHYDALWHLDAIGVRVGNDSGAWDEVLDQKIKPSWTPVTVAIIDTSVAWEHPNLTEVIDTQRMIDFFSARLGAFPARDKATADADTDSELADNELPGKSVAAELAGLAGDGTTALLRDLLLRLQSPNNIQSRVLPATSPAFSAHGTAMAGLIGARPATFESARPQFLGDIAPLTPGGKPVPIEDLITELPSVLPYAGVNPFCSIVPISTNLELDPEQMILALLYAVLIGTDVIALPRDIADPRRFRLLPGTGLPDDEQVSLMEATHPVGLDEESEALWDELNTLLVAVSKCIPIVAAAGNGSDERVIYPASVSDASNGIVAVGAQAATGQPAGYSPSAQFVDVFAPSGDGERLDDDLRRIDTLSTAYRERDHSADYLAELNTNLTEPVDASTFALQDLISTDVPGRYGYNGSDVVEDETMPDTASDAIDDFGSYFCNFSGTSGAVGVAAGFLSLAFAAGRLPRGAADAGVQARALMRKASGTEGGDVVPGIAPKSPDGVNGLHWSRIV